MKPSPLAQVKDRFESKEKLVEAIEAFGDDLFLDRLNEDKGLERVSNAKLLRLHDVLSAVKDEFGSRDKLIDAICEAEGRKDEGYEDRLGRWPTPRLWDWYRSVKRKAAKKAS